MFGGLIQVLAIVSIQSGLEGIFDNMIGPTDQITKNKLGHF